MSNKLYVDTRYGKIRLFGPAHADRSQYRQQKMKHNTHTNEQRCSIFPYHVLRTRLYYTSTVHTVYIYHKTVHGWNTSKPKIFYASIETKQGISINEICLNNPHNNLHL
jgi:hypothetical protein